MLKTQLLHPEILEALGGSGHGGKVLIADGNYPFNTRANPAAKRAYLNFTHGKLNAVEVLEVLVGAIPIEAADVMTPDSGDEPSIFADFRRLLPDLELKKNGRFAFYDLARDPDCCLVIATGEQRIYANILLTIGVVPPPK
ncbi:MAG: RbsD/FucU family protein [Chloroflexi bacterium]|nr:RbsD/FucU family protein [Chloroflexota bacterium]MCC6895746.1 RbsD/FucU family protein [Anaerolineae bacterium]